MVNTCGCQPGKPPVCDFGKRLLDRETTSVRERVRAIGYGPLDPGRIAAVNRLQEDRLALIRHMNGGDGCEEYSAAEREGMEVG